MSQATPEVLVNSILGKVSDVLLNGDGTVVPKSDDHFLAFLSPGIPMVNGDFDFAKEGFGGVYRRNVDEESPEESTGPQEGPSVAQQLASDALRKYAQAESFAAIVDQVPDVSGVVNANRITQWNPETRISRVYGMALQQSQVYDNQPDAATVEKLDRWRSKLVTTRTEKDVVTDEEVEVTGPSALVEQYNLKMTAYLAAALDYNDLRISALSGKDQEAVHRAAINGPLLQKKVEAAMADWSGAGHKGDYEALTAAIASVEDRAFALLKQRYKQDFARSVLTNPSTGSNFAYCAPASASFATSNAGWTKFYFNSSSFESNYSFSTSSSGGSAGFHIGALGVSGGANVTQGSYQGTFDTSTFSMSFEMCRLPISRPWFALEFLLSSYWRFDESNPVLTGAVISDGAMPPKGLMPAITTDCIMIRNLELHLGSSHDQFAAQRSHIDAGGAVSFGPFHLGGRHAQSSGTSGTAASWTDQGIRIDGMQLLGFSCFTLPKAPDPVDGPFI